MYHLSSKIKYKKRLFPADLADLRRVNSAKICARLRQGFVC